MMDISGISLSSLCPFSLRGVAISVVTVSPLPTSNWTSSDPGNIETDGRLGKVDPVNGAFLSDGMDEILSFWGLNCSWEFKGLAMDAFP